MNKYAIIAKNIVKNFKNTKALNGLTLEIPSGITYGLLGPNGSGKTTLIRIMVGIVKATSGEIKVLGFNPGEAEVAQMVGYMTQIPALYQDLTIRENLEFFSKIFGVKSKDQSKRINELIDLVELEKKRNSVVSSLSGGMKQRTSLACALVHSPKLLFLDEPTVGVDPALRISFWNYFKKLNEQGVTIVVSSHVMDEAQRCDKLGLLRSGRLLTEGTLDQILKITSKQNLEDAFLALENEGTTKEETN